MGTSEFTALGKPVMAKNPILGGVKILQVTLFEGNQDKFRPVGPLRVSYIRMQTTFFFFPALLGKET